MAAFSELVLTKNSKNLFAPKKQYKALEALSVFVLYEKPLFFSKKQR
jgi:hypothetical protein